MDPDVITMATLDGVRLYFRSKGNPDRSHSDTGRDKTCMIMQSVQRERERETLVSVTTTLNGLLGSTFVTSWRIAWWARRPELWEFCQALGDLQGTSFSFSIIPVWHHTGVLFLFIYYWMLVSVFSNARQRQNNKMYYILYIYILMCFLTDLWSSWTFHPLCLPSAPHQGNKQLF